MLLWGVMTDIVWRKPKPLQERGLSVLVDRHAFSKRRTATFNCGADRSPRRDRERFKNITADAFAPIRARSCSSPMKSSRSTRPAPRQIWKRARRRVQALVAPLQETLPIYKQQVDQMEQARSQSYGMLSAELKGVVEAQNAVRSETSKLVNALRAAPRTRGRWGEHTLRNVLELSGLSSYCDFSTEESFARDGSVSRPDVVIRLPGGRSIVVDAKTSLRPTLMPSMRSMMPNAIAISPYTPRRFAPTSSSSPEKPIGTG